MLYSDSTHFSEQLSYKILFISSYGVKDINFASFKYLQQIFRKQENSCGFSHPGELSRGR
jgi:hypothetical protein